MKEKANNGYNRTQVKDSHFPVPPEHAQPVQKGHSEKRKRIETNHDELDNSRIKYRPTPDQNHKGFQFGTNPEMQSSFEKSLIEKEKDERKEARERYIMGIQGRDGGKKPYETGNINN